MKKIFSALFVVLFATSMMAQTGLTCEDAIPVDSTYRGTVDGPCELWYTATTYDLPLHVYFSPDNLNSELSPEVMVDLTCVPGVYDDPKVDSLLTMVSDFGVDFPVELWCDKVIRDGKVEWDLSINQSYRDQLAEFGITYNVQAYVKVKFYEGGTIRLTPDTAFTSCMDNAHYILLDDSIDILAEDTDRSFIVPYSEWQNDSIRFVWTGDQPAQVFLATTNCDFTPDANNAYVWNHFEVVAETPYKLYSSEMKEAIKNQQGGGIFYGKIVSSTPGKLVVEKIPMNKPKGDAILMQYDQAIQVGANDPTLYCFPRTWAATQFIASAPAATSVYFSNHPDFTTSTEDANVLAAYEFDKEDGQRALYLSNTEVKSLTDNVIDDYVYVRFQAAAATTITPSAWLASRCVVNSVLIHPNKTFTVANNSNTIYRFKYDDFAGYGFVLKWANTLTDLPTYVADTCTFGLTTGDPHVIEYANIRKGKQWTVEPETYSAWASRVDAEGYLYVRFNSKRAGNVTFVCEKPVELEPVYTTISETLCYGDSYEWNGQVYAKSGEYSQTFTAANGADSIVTLNLTILAAVPLTEETAIVCHGESFDWQGTTYTESGEYSVTLKNVNGCDSVVLLHLHVLSAVAPTSEEVTVAYGETYEWHGVVYAESGSYTITLQDENGCDYQATLHLTVLPNPEKTDLQPADMMSLNLQDAFKVMTMEQGLWSAQDVKMHWDGVSPLHVFVAKQKVYALTPYNRHVLHYEMIPAGADWTLSKDMMAAWESYIAEGVLYVRFLTELPGTLTTTVAE